MVYGGSCAFWWSARTGDAVHCHLTDRVAMGQCGDPSQIDFDAYSIHTCLYLPLQFLPITVAISGCTLSAEVLVAQGVSLVISQPPTNVVLGPIADVCLWVLESRCEKAVYAAEQVRSETN